MNVSVWAGTGKKQLGIRVGAANRRQYFKPNWSQIEVQMDGLWQVFTLTGGFLEDCPEFRDSGAPRIKDWLRKHNLLNWPKGLPPKLTLEPLEGNRFRLLPT